VIVRDLSAWYGESHVLQGVGFDVAQGGVVTLLGRNGAGKTTILKSVMGIIRKRSGSVRIADVETIAAPSRVIARLGLGFVPEERGIFSTLSVDENLMLPPAIGHGGMQVERVYELFPNLRARGKTRGTSLSGGEQQMLAIARILRTGARILLLDEPTEGLAPVIVEQIRRILHLLKEEGFTILLVEQNLRFAQDVSDKYCVIESGHLVDTASSDSFNPSSEKMKRYLGV
jgi:branched-chain amino acid transport system ATP-binding protein